MKFDATDRLEKINEAIVNLFERRSRAAQREAQRTGRGEMTTGRDGNQYPLGADPTRAQPGSALANQQQSQPKSNNRIQPLPNQPASGGLRLTGSFKPTAPAMPAPGTVAYGTQNQGSSTPAPGTVAYGTQNQGSSTPAARPESSLMAAGRSVAGSNLNPTTPTSPSLAAGRSVAGYNSGSGTPTTAPSSPGLTDIYKMGSAAFGGEIKAPPSPSAAAAPATSGRQAIQPGSLPQIERQLQSGPSTTQTSPQGKGSLEQDLQSMGGILRNVGLLPSAGGSPKSSTAPVSSASAPNFVEATPEERSASASAIARSTPTSRNTPAAPAPAAQTAKTPETYGGYTPPAREDIRDIRSRRAAEVKPGENSSIEAASGPVYSFLPKSSAFGSETKTTQKADVSSTGRAGISPTDKPYDQYGADEGDRGASANYAARQARRETGDTRSGQQIMAANAAKAEENRRIQRGIAYEPTPATQYTSTTRSQ